MLSCLQNIKNANVIIVNEINRSVISRTSVNVNRQIHISKIRYNAFKMCYKHNSLVSFNIDKLKNVYLKLLVSSVFLSII